MQAGAANLPHRRVGGFLKEIRRRRMAGVVLKCESAERTRCPEQVLWVRLERAA